MSIELADRIFPMTQNWTSTSPNRPLYSPCELPGTPLCDLTNGSQAYKVSTPKPLTENEKIQIARYRSLRESIHNGPLYTILGENVRVTKPGERPNKPAASFNAFEGMPKYSHRYTKKRRMIPKLDTRPYGESSAFVDLLLAIEEVSCTCKSRGGFQ